LLTKLRARISKILLALGRLLSKAGFKPNTITLLSLAPSFTALYFAYIHEVFLFILFVCFSSLLDVLDGAVARASGKKTVFGAFLDSTIDRVNDALFITSLYFLGINVLLVFLILITSYLISYTRARAEGLGIRIEGIGIIERPERIVFIVVIAVLTYFDIFTASIIASIFLILSSFSVFQRIYFVFKKASS